MESCPAGSSGVWFCKARHFLARSGSAGWTTARHCVSRYGLVRSCLVPWGSVGYCTVWFCLARHYFGRVVRCKARFSVLRHALFRRGTAGSGFARLCAAGQAMVRRHLGLVWPGEVGRCIARQGLGFMRSGVVTQGSVMRGAVSCGLVW